MDRGGSVGPPYPSEFISKMQRGRDGEGSGTSQQRGGTNTGELHHRSYGQQPYEQHRDSRRPSLSQVDTSTAAPTPIRPQQHSIGTGSSPPHGMVSTPRLGGRRRSSAGGYGGGEQWNASEQRAREQQYEIEGTVVGIDGRVTFMPNNAGTEVSPRRDARAEQEEKAKVRWAWSVDRAGRVSKPLMSAIQAGPLKNELHEIVRLLSSNTIEVQTTLQPSYTAELAGRDSGGNDTGAETGSKTPNIVTDHLRSVGTQNGLGLSKVNASMQVVEGDIASTAPTAQLDYNKLVLLQQNQQDAEQQELLARALEVQGVSGGAYSGGRGGAHATSTFVKGNKTGGNDMFEMGVSSGPTPESAHHVVQRGPDGTLRVVSNNTSAHFPYCGIPAEEFPVLMGEARRQGVANQYGFISLPNQPFSLPPRRKVRVIQPVEYPHLYGSHHLSIDEQSATQLSRAYTLWTQSTGFVPKF